MVYKLFTRFVQFLLGLALVLACSALSVSFGNNVSASMTAPDELTAEGFTQFNQGNTTAALKLWRAASDSYRQTKNQEGVIGSAINQSLALRSLGQYPQACQVLAQEALQLPSANTLCSKQLRSTEVSSLDLSRIRPNSTQQLAVQHLGIALQLIGDLSNAKLALQSIEKTAAPQRRGEIQLALGNVERAIYSQLRDRVSRSSDSETLGTSTIELKSQAETVLTHYEQAAAIDSSKLKAQINQFSFLADLSQWITTQQEQNNQLPEIVALDQAVRDRIIKLSPIVVQTNFAAFSPIDQVYARLNVVNSLIEQTQVGQSINPAATQLATEALSTAKTLSNPRAISYSLGTLGRLAHQRKDLKTAQSQLSEALSMAESAQASDAAYQWEQELAKIAKQQGNAALALRYYQSAIENLDRVRGNLLPISSDVQLSFREQVEPIYREYMDLLVEQSQSNLSPIIETYNRLRIAEVENFLQCGRLALVPLSQQPQSPDETIFYILNLNRSIGVIVQSALGTQRFYRADADAVQNALNGVTFNLQNVVQNDRVVLPDETILKEYGQTLYDQIIAPAERAGFLAKKGRIAFVLDNTLQGMPVGLLYDGKTYLSQRYPLRLSIGSEIAQDQRSRGRNTLIAALSESSPSLRDRRINQILPPLTNVESEVQAIRSAFPGSEILNQEFTLERLEDKIQQGNYDIIHIATHGQFSSVPDETFVVAWNRLITAPQLSVLLKSRTSAEIDLLVLSACQTAKGDVRSTLGLAGIAAQSGARSTVASLWLVDDAATALLVQNFYRNLAAGQSKAIALQQAQISLQNSPYSNPYFWSAFVLVGAA
ncbi:TPR repeat protein (plasmid) [Leptolyngbya boryana NIES-2135]|jgi:CHAT domain-containing protein|uniref:TPR repeat protein n=1 Tax=Leptolyngbya boryana NIES-2135 TaxID=1973484 RepID=A0A1Z4JR79_LEPBY|nr:MULTISPECIES: CHAT domain-containing protein [Leptolyngbya]BAY59219.1 TPR repeat protein [Leptolyngbya boryana NIES-2135]MBD2372808.1 CHAT domain-containing protein [Leptolyngbya sp. FACHB-238]MBD2397440.1 CHAT domain-containing protein [Leptolyngbya sp. FACHB-239]MBD2403755.1 CHAT domain-containing protein [Leptolyngbya sp. FACHB-402]ULP33412.1 CHAT domain-containing protein [Leptolyngbya boryana IU 594]